VRTFEPGEIRPNFCPLCFKLLDAATNCDGDDFPGPGDFTACIGCGEILTWAADMTLEASKLEDVPISIRAKFARLKMLIREQQAGNLPRWGVKGE
jgi:hypothetical protein